MRYNIKYREKIASFPIYTRIIVKIVSTSIVYSLENVEHSQRKTFEFKGSTLIRTTEYSNIRFKIFFASIRYVLWNLRLNFIGYRFLELPYADSSRRNNKFMQKYCNIGV